MGFITLVLFFFYVVCHYFYFLTKDGFYHIELDSDEGLSFLQTTILLILIIITYRTLSSIFKIREPILNGVIIGSGYVLLLMLYFLGVLSYVLQNGIALGLSYNDRLTANTGGGLSIILMYAYIPALILIYISKPSKISLIICLLLSVFCGLIYYVVIGGSRNVLAAGIFSLIYLALYFKHITKKFFALIIVCGVFTLMILELYRYANNITDAINFIMNGGMQVILFAFESFSPIHAVININEALDKRLIEPQYLSTFFNEFSIIIPRFLWEDKPINVLNNGYFYTTEILSLDTNLTMSPTFLGTSLIMFGSWFYWVGGFISGVILFIFDRSFSHSSNLYWKIILLSSVGYLFFWVRDGFEVFCYILIKFFIVMFIYKNLTIIYKSLARKNEF